MNKLPTLEARLEEALVSKKEDKEPIPIIHIWFYGKTPTKEQLLTVIRPIKHKDPGAARLKFGEWRFEDIELSKMPEFRHGVIVEIRPIRGNQIYFVSKEKAIEALEEYIWDRANPIEDSEKKPPPKPTVPPPPSKIAKKKPPPKPTVPPPPSKIAKKKPPSKPTVPSPSSKITNGHAQVICPMCGTAHGNRAQEVVGYIRMGIELYCQRLIREYDMNKTFGIVQGTGRGGFKNIEPIGVDAPEAEPFLEPMKKLMLLAIEHYIKIGVITREEIEDHLDAIIKEVIP